MRKSITYFVTALILLVCHQSMFGQADSTTTVTTQQSDEEKPAIYYSLNPQKYEIAGIRVTGAKNMEEYILISYSGLTVGQVVPVPGDEITSAIKRFWKNGLFSDVRIEAEKIEDGKVWLEIKLKQRPRITKVTYHKIKKSEREDLELKVSLVKGNQITPNTLDRAKTLIKKYYEEKSFHNAEVTIKQTDDLSQENYVYLDIYVDKKTKTGVHKIYTEGNLVLSDMNLQKAMKKTNEKGNILNLFRTKKFIQENYENDKQALIDKYNELGYRDAVITWDSIAQYDEKRVDVFMKIDEGRKYYIKDIRWIGNTLYPSDHLARVLNMLPGDVYNQKKLRQRTQEDEDALANVYMDKGYLFYNLTPIEINVENDSVDLEMRIVEGQPATINKVIINGNDRLYEQVIRRELRTKPGALFNKSELVRSVREIAQTGHFNPETINPVPQPNPENGTVDIVYNLESKANDQVEFSAGWGATGIIGKLSLKFTNFSVKNMLNPKSYKGIIPQGEGQTLTISAQTNARYYQSYSVSFLDPWLGGKRPNSLSIGAYYSRQTDISSNAGYNSNYYGAYNNPYYGGYGGGYGGYGGGYGGYGGGYGGYGNGYGYDYTAAMDPSKSFQMLGVNVGFGKRLSWPDDYFVLQAQLAYQLYILKDWRYFVVENGTCNNINLTLSLVRNSQDQPIYPRRGSNFTLSVQATPPYSSFDGVDYASITDRGERNRWIEYHKWSFRSKTFTALTPSEKHTMVLMTRADFGFLGHYNSAKRSPFETYYMGGDGMTGYSSTYATETIALRGYKNGSLTPYGYEGYAFARLAMELRFPFMLQPSSTIYGLVFAEAGNAWSRMENFNPFNLKRSAGVGVRIMLPMIGLMGIDWAYGFDTVHGSKDYGGSNLHFIIGQEF